MKNSIITRETGRPLVERRTVEQFSRVFDGSQGANAWYSFPPIRPRTRPASTLQAARALHILPVGTIGATLTLVVWQRMPGNGWNVESPGLTVLDVSPRDPAGVALTVNAVYEVQLAADTEEVVVGFFDPVGGQVVGVNVAVVEPSSW